MIRSLMARRDEARRNGADAGFTLIELLIVIIILGILAAIVVFSVTGITDKGKTSACQTTKSTIDTAFEAYAASLDDPSSALTSMKVSALAPKWLHAEPPNNSKIGTLTYATASTTVGDVDGATC